MKLEIEQLIEKYRKEFSVKEQNSSDKGILRGALREELIPSLREKLSQSPNWLKQPLKENK